ncbi:MAG TPA: patatin-like phospholipase family protein [Caulobacteraceae bacterium]|jgi:NTE family protein|nr:patatin-like phospholipase family protein [Caulobacteraceae bacterium]
MTNAAPPKRVLVLQGGGALGAYQAGAYEGLAEIDVRPDWVAGISIGAINAAIIAGNAPSERLSKLREFWRQVSDGPQTDSVLGSSQIRAWVNQANAIGTTLLGSHGFFTPRIPPPFFYPPGAPEALSFYDTSPLKETLERLVDFDRINAKETRISVGAVNIRTGNFAYFDNCRQPIGPEHIMASGALPPGFPPIEIDGEYYWDGGLVSNTPLEYVLDEDTIDNLLILQVDLFNARGPMPKTLAETDERVKDIRYSSRTRHNTNANLKIHQTKLAMRTLIDGLPEELRNDPRTQELKSLMAENAVTIVQLIYRRRPYEGASKDYEFSRSTMLDHWGSGLDAVRRLRPYRRRIMTPPRESGVQVFDVKAGDAAPED